MNNKSKALDKNFIQKIIDEDLINNKYLLLQRGRKNYYLVIVK